MTFELLEESQLAGLPALVGEIHGDTRNVLLTVAGGLHTVETGDIKPRAWPRSAWPRSVWTLTVGNCCIQPLSLMPVEYLTPAMEDRAFEVQMLLADRGQHRAPSVPDLPIAAMAEKAGLTVLAVDRDFDLVAEITGQPVETLALK